MNRIFRAVLTAVLALGCVLPAAAQSLTTTYATDNSSGGNTFDLKSTRDLRIDSFDIHLGSAGTTTQVAVYWRTGTANGFQANPAGWTLLGTATVVSQGPGNPTHLPIGGLKLVAGQTYGMYITLVNNDVSFLYTNGTTTFANSDLSFVPFYGEWAPAFDPNVFYPRIWNGTVYYSDAGFTTCAAEGLKGSKLALCQKTCEVKQTTSTLNGLILLYRQAYREDPPCAR